MSLQLQTGAELPHAKPAKSAKDWNVRNAASDLSGRGLVNKFGAAHNHGIHRIHGICSAARGVTLLLQGYCTHFLTEAELACKRSVIAQRREQPDGGSRGEGGHIVVHIELAF